ncbi:MULTISPECIES: hemolysin family protein [unclassified Halorubrum]|uniref:hemolysin family protein n=1 Tax=unclassified Halorubrum TaxID=2642239 RepID=UPI000B994F86|nr:MULTISPECIES: hemolysin family protein [unclassified Halorubrum]OYR43470.1 cobalt transporter [Halorubrum sp. Eb13]OYR46974.1 cobalt transporter [Halorubrum sp. Hd13]OYR47969.1 cobalt transporter [Halorubrum sp. Ea8]
MVAVAVSVSRVFGALVLVVLNGFFVASEFAFVRVRSTSVEQLAAEGRPGSGALQDVMGSLDDYLAATQLGITLASLGLGWIGEPAVAALIEPVLGSVLPESAVHLVAFAIGFSVITFLHVVFGELAPKTIAIAQAERMALMLAPPMKLSYYLFSPGIVVFNGAANAFTRAIGIPPASETDETMGEREIRRVLARSGEAGRVDPSEVDMIEGVFQLDDTVVREVMVPRPDVVTLAAELTLPEIRETVLEAGHTRYPVVTDEDADRVVGFVDVKDVLRAGEDGDESATAAGLAREIVVVPETTAIGDLLVQFREERRQMAAVVDEWGAFEGIVTVEDIAEALVGDLRDEFDTERGEHTIRTREGGAYEADGSVSLSVVNDALGTDLEGNGYDTLGGLVLDRLGRTPESGDVAEAGGHRFEVTAVDGARISTVRIASIDGGDGAGGGRPGAGGDGGA